METVVRYGSDLALDGIVGRWEYVPDADLPCERGDVGTASDRDHDFETWYRCCVATTRARSLAGRLEVPASNAARSGARQGRGGRRRGVRPEREPGSRFDVEDSTDERKAEVLASKRGIRTPREGSIFTASFVALAYPDPEPVVKLDDLVRRTRGRLDGCGDDSTGDPRDGEPPCPGFVPLGAVESPSSLGPRPEFGRTACYLGTQ